MMRANCKKCGYSWNTISKHPRCTRCKSRSISYIPENTSTVEKWEGSKSYEPMLKGGSLTEFHLWLKGKSVDLFLRSQLQLVNYYREYLDSKGLGHTHLDPICKVKRLKR